MNGRLETELRHSFRFCNGCCCEGDLLLSGVGRFQPANPSFANHSCVQETDLALVSLAAKSCVRFCSDRASHALNKGSSALRSFWGYGGGSGNIADSERLDR